MGRGKGMQLDWDEDGGVRERNVSDGVGGGGRTVLYWWCAVP